MAQFDLSLERESDVPVGTQLVWKLRGAVATGALRAGDRLPGVRELADDAGVNVNTVRAVYARLAEQGVIVSEHGRGTFVAPGTADHTDLRGLAQRAASEARQLGLDPREVAVLLYADAPARESADMCARRVLRAEIEELEHDLAELDARLGKLARPRAEGAPRRASGGPRLLTTAELEAVRDGLAAQIADRRDRLSRHGDAEPAAEAASDTAVAWPELFFSGRPAPSSA
jgi:DNA-binding transcriptional regulator YhcF (GntR family)